MGIGTLDNLDPDQALAHTQALRERVLGGSAVADAYAVGPVGSGSGERVLVLGGTGYIGQALVPELKRRGFSPVVLARPGSDVSALGDAEIVRGTPAVAADVERAFSAGPVHAVISLLSSRRPNDPDECRTVDYTSVIHGVAAAAQHGCARFVHISDYGCYRPELLPQVYKLQVEGELIGGHHGRLPWTIIRPTAYFPYLSVNFGDVKNGGTYRLFDHGEWALSNPIAREDLAEFIVNALCDDDAVGRVLPVGGPWSADNVVSIKTAGDMMFEVLDQTPRWEVTSLKSWDTKTARLRRAATLYPKLRNVAFYLDAAKYWSVVDHVAPPHGTVTLRDFMHRLKDREFPTGSFRDRMKSGTALMPTDV